MINIMKRNSNLSKSGAKRWSYKKNKATKKTNLQESSNLHPSIDKFLLDQKQWQMFCNHLEEQHSMHEKLEHGFNSKISLELAGIASNLISLIQYNSETRVLGNQ